MKSDAKPNRRLPPKAEAAVIYRGIKIEPINGKRSAMAKALREAFLEEKALRERLLEKSEKKRRQAALG